MTIDKFKNTRINTKCRVRTGGIFDKGIQFGDHPGLQKTLIIKEFFLSGILVDVVGFLKADQTVPAIVYTQG